MDRLDSRARASAACSAPTTSPVLHPGVRLFAGGLPHVRYLKISEGCDHGCAFCAIPLMRGKHRSFALDEIVREAQLLEAQGAREVNLVAQDLAHYGRDLRDGKLGAARRARARSCARRRFRGFGCCISTRPGSRRALLELMATRAAHPAVSRHADPARVGRGAGAHAPSRAPAHDSRERSRASARSCPTSPFARRASSAFPGETDERFRDAARRSSRRCSSSASARSRIRRRKARAPRRWLTTCPSR